MRPQSYLEKLKKENFKCGVILLTGFPNAGKSTLLNHLIKKKVSIVSPKIHTTKDVISGIINIKKTQLIFTDTPGIIDERKFYSKKLSRSISTVESNIDCNLFVYDLTKRFNNDILVKILGTTSKFKKNYLILNKIDLVNKKSLLDTSQNINANVKFLETFMVSAKKKKGLDHLIEKISLQMPKRNWKFRKDTITDKTMNFQISEITREKIFNLINQEVPYLIKIETVIENKSNIVKVYQKIFVTKESQKSIIIGKNGRKIKMIGTKSRIDIEKLLNKKIFLNLVVKVN